MRMSRSLVSRISGNTKHWSFVICDWLFVIFLDQVEGGGVRVGEEDTMSQAAADALQRRHLR